MNKSPIKRERSAAGLLQRELAADLGVSLVTVKRWEAGTRFPHRRFLRKLERRLGVTASELLAFYEAAGSARRPTEAPRTSRAA